MSQLGKVLSNVEWEGGYDLSQHRREKEPSVELQ